jgi:hypothetical protein
MSQSEQICHKCGKPLTDYGHCDVSESQIDNTPFVDSRTIGYIAAKRKFDPVREAHLVEKAKRTTCRCKHFTQTRPCLYHTCRHMPENHYGVINANNKEV